MNRFLFIEVLPPPTKTIQSESENNSNYVEAIIAAVDPQRCGSLVKQVSYIFPPNTDILSHLKRVRPGKGRQQRVDEHESPPPKKFRNNDDVSTPSNHQCQKKKAIDEKTMISLEVLLGSCSMLEGILRADNKGTNIKNNAQECEIFGSVETLLAQKFGLEKVYREKVPGRPPESRAEWEEFHAVWPTTFYPMNTLEHKTRQLELSKSEIDVMIRGVEAALDDAKDESNVLLSAPGTVIVGPPPDGRILSRSSDERKRQSDRINCNPLATSILLAIQGMSRSEREAATGNGLDSPEFQKGQYLCTGCDVFTTQEPSVFEAMALVHSRIRRVVFLEEEEGVSSTLLKTNKTHKNGMFETNGSNSATSSYVKGLTEMYVHSLPGTNHKFRAFVCRTSKFSCDKASKALDSAM